MIENPQTIGEHIRKRRQELKIWQKEVATLLDVSEDTITYWENGRSVPQIQFYPKITQFLGYSPFQTDTSTFAGRIKAYRIEHGISQADFAKLTGFDETSIRAWENGQREPLLSKRRKINEIISKKELSN